MIRPAFLLCLALLFGAAGCAAPRLENTLASPDAVATAVLHALTASDRPALDALALSESEFKTHVWPELPAARPERNLPFSYVWGDLHQKSTLKLGQTLGAHGGKRYTLIRVRFAGVTDYQTYRVHRDAAFDVRDEAGQLLTVQVCGSMLEKDGAWKVFSYVVD